MEVIRQTRSTPRARLLPPLTKIRATRTPKSNTSTRRSNNTRSAAAKPEPPPTTKKTDNNNTIETIEVIESSQEQGPEFLTEIDTCQMSPLLFDSDSETDFNTSTPIVAATAQTKRIASPMTISDSPIPNNQEGVKRMPSEPKTPSKTQKSVTRRRTPRSTRRSVLMKRAKSASEPAIMHTPSSDSSELSSLSGSTEEPLPPPRTTRQARIRLQKHDDSSDSVIENTPRTTRSTAGDRIATRMRVATGQQRMHRMEPPRPKRKTTPSKKRKAASPERIPSDVTTDFSQQDRQNILGDSIEPSLPLAYQEQIPVDPKRSGADFDLNVRIESSQEVQIVEHRNVIISLSSSGETLDEQRERDKQNDSVKNDSAKMAYLRFDKSMFRRSPDLFDTFEDDKPVAELPRRRNMFVDNHRMSFFDRLGVPKPTTSMNTSAIQTKKRVLDSSIDMFGDNATFGETRRPVQPEKVVEKELSETRISNANSSSVFEITRNDVFSNLLRVNSDSDMSSIKMSEDEIQPEVTPRRRPSCLEGLQIQRRTPTKIRVKANLFDSDAMNSGEIAATQEQTPQKKMSLYERLCRTDPTRTFKHRKRKSRVAGGSQQPSLQSPERQQRKKKPIGQSPDGRKKRLTKMSSDERLTKVPWTGRRLDDYFKRTTVNNSSTSMSNEATTTAAATTEENAKEDTKFKPKPSCTLLVLSSDDDT